MNTKALSGEDSELDLIIEMVHDWMERGNLDRVAYMLDIVSVAMREQFNRDACLCFLTATLPVRDRPEVREQRQSLRSVFWDENSPREGKSNTAFLLHGL